MPSSQLSISLTMRSIGSPDSSDSESGKRGLMTSGLQRACDVGNVAFHAIDFGAKMIVK